MSRHDWNVVVSTYDREFSTSIRLLRPFGEVWPTRYRNVLVMRVDDVVKLLRSVEETLATDASIANSVARISPVTTRFCFESATELEAEARRAIEPWAGRLESRSFHVRVHRRGFKHRVSSHGLEQRLGRHALDALERAGARARVEFNDPDLTIVVEIVGRCAGAAIWSREQLEQLQLLRID